MNIRSIRGLTILLVILASACAPSAQVLRERLRQLPPMVLADAERIEEFSGDIEVGARPGFPFSRLCMDAAVTFPPGRTYGAGGGRNFQHCFELIVERISNNSVRISFAIPADLSGGNGPVRVSFVRDDSGVVRDTSVTSVTGRRVSQEFFEETMAWNSSSFGIPAQRVRFGQKISLQVDQNRTEIQCTVRGGSAVRGRRVLILMCAEDGFVRSLDGGIFIMQSILAIDVDSGIPVSLAARSIIYAQNQSSGDFLTMRMRFDSY